MPKVKAPAPKTVVIKDNMKEPVYQKNVKKSKVVNVGDLLKQYQKEYETAVNARATFIANQQKLYKKRFGIRPKKTFPWPGASNLSLPLQDKTVRKIKPLFVDVLDRPSPMADFMPVGPEDIESAGRTSWVFDWVLRVKTKIYEKQCLAADKTLSRGFCIAKTIYEKNYEPCYKSITRDELLQWQNEIDLLDPANVEQFATIISEHYKFDITDENDKEKITNIIKAIYEGAEVVEFTILEKVKDAPELIILDPEAIVVPSDTLSIFDFEQAAWLDHPYEQSIDDFIKDMQSEKWNKIVGMEVLRAHGVDNIEEYYLNGETNSPVKQNQAKREGQVERQEDNRTGVTKDKKTITIHERYCWYDGDGDGIKERHVVNYCEDYLDGALRFINFPYYRMKKWPFVKIPYEIISEGHYTPRGVVELLNPIASSINIQHNQKINRQTLDTAFMFYYVPGKVNPDNIRFIPGQGIPVAGPANQSFGVVQTQSKDNSFVQEEQILKAWGEELIGSPDYGIAGANNQTGVSDPRTKYELEGIRVQSSTTMSLDINIWKTAWAEIYERLFDLYIEFGPESDWAYLDGQPIPKEFGKDQIDFKYNIIPAGDIRYSSPEQEEARARGMFAMLRDDPFIRQRELREDFVRATGRRNAKRLVKTVEEVQMEQQQQMMMAMAQQAQGAKPGSAK